MSEEDGFDAATDYVRVGVKSGGCSGLSYDLKFDKAKSEDDKIFIDNEITIAVEKNLSISSRNNIRVLWRNKRKRIYITIQMQIELADVESFSL
jgi:Fe-S cluster assembly iron-binding protein IscA